MRQTPARSPRPSWAGLLIATLLAAALAGPAQARWLKAQTPHFNVYSETSEAELRGYAQDLEVYDRLLRLIHGAPDRDPLGRRLDIYLVSSQGEVQRLYGSAGGGQVAGFYLRTPWNIFAVASRAEEADFVLRHEYLHHFMLQYAPGAYPAWLVEGYAEYFAPTRISGGKVEVGGPPEKRLQNVSGSWPTMTTLLGKSVAEIPAADRPSFYATAWLLTHYFMRDATTTQTYYRQLQAYMKLVAEGGDPVASMEKATGVDPPALERALRGYMNQRLSGFGLEFRDPEAPLTIEALPASADELLIDRLRVNETLPKAQEKPLLERIRKAAARYPGDRFAEMALAETEASFGDVAAGVAILERRLAAAPDDAEALELAGLARMQLMSQAKGEARVALAREAQPYFARAYKADPNRFATLFAFALSRRLLDAPYPEDATLDALLAAYRLAPQVPEIRFEAARALLLRGRRAEASALLGPLINDPHGGPVAQAARKLLAGSPR